MPFTKGNSGNPLGRPKGSLNHSTKEFRELLSHSIDSNKIMEMLSRIEEPVDYINAVSKLFPFFEMDIMIIIILFYGHSTKAELINRLLTFFEQVIGQTLEVILQENLKLQIFGAQMDVLVVIYIKSIYLTVMQLEIHGHLMLVVIVVLM